MNGTPWVLMALIVGLVVAFLGATLYKKYKKENKESDYRSFFMMGLIWTIVGVPLYFSSNNIAFLAMGIIFLVVGLANKSKWKEPQPATLQKKKIMIVAFGVTFLLVFTIALIVFIT